MDILKIIGRDKPLITDIVKLETSIKEKVASSSFLIIGGAGSIGQAVTKEIFSRGPKKLHVIDISENNLVELVRDIRSSSAKETGDFRTFVIDCGSSVFEAFFNSEGPYDYVLNLSALKHVRSEKDQYSLMRMIEVNILNTVKTIQLCAAKGTKKYFCVSTDKAANPVNMMGASKRIMEMFLCYYGSKINISSARFANVAFSDGSLLHGFRQRLMNDQPIAAPNDVRRYFVTPKEAGEICLISVLFGENGEIFFPKLNKDLNLITFSSIAEEFLNQNGYKAFNCNSEEEAIQKVLECKKRKEWSCYFSKSDTTGEKDFEEFYREGEQINTDSFDSLGIVKNNASAAVEKLEFFLSRVSSLVEEKKWNKEELVNLFHEMIPEFIHVEKNKYLDSKM